MPLLARQHGKTMVLLLVNDADLDAILSGLYAWMGISDTAC